MNKTEEKKYEQLKKLGQELHVPIPEHFLELEVTLDGKIIQTLKQRSHSWVRNAYNLLLSQMASKNLDNAGVFGAGLLSIKDTAGAIADGTFGANISANVNFENPIGYGYRAPAADITFGILVGNNNGVWTFEQYVLLGPIAEGIAAGALNHTAMGTPTKSWAAPVFTITWVRYMNNNSPGDVLVKEVALCTKGIAGNAVVTWFMNSRDVLGATVTIPATGQLKVTYTISLAFP